ncbi:MAG: hypothetical protein HFJ54_01555 [Clostridia bacterium]|nr:hypothetical protein [Clostridia bacterium]
MRRKNNASRFQIAIIFAVVLFSIFASIAYAIDVGIEYSTFEMEQLEKIQLKNYYYNQLDEIEKEIYKGLSDHKEDLLLGKEVTFKVSTYEEESQLGYLYYYKLVKRAINAYIYDNPESEIWMDNYKRGYYKLKGYIYMALRPIEMEKGSLNWEEGTKEALLELETVVAEFIKTLSGTDKEKLRQIHDWLASKATYDDSLELPNTRTAYGTIINGKSVCSGFAYAYKYIANLADLDVIYVVGKVYDATNDIFISHAWNVVCIDGEYSLVDITLDLPSNGKIRNTYLFSEIEDKVHYPNNYYYNYPF